MKWSIQLQANFRLLHDIYKEILKRIVELNMRQNVDKECRVTIVLAKIEMEGVPVSIRRVKAFDKRLNKLIMSIELQTFRKWGRLNLKSPQQVGDLLYNRCRINVSGKKSTSKEVLKKLLQRQSLSNEIKNLIEDILLHRKGSKLKNTYSKPFLERIHNGKIFAKLHHCALIQKYRHRTDLFIRAECASFA